MPCTEGEYLKEQFEEAVKEKKALHSQALPDDLEEKKARIEKIQQMGEFVGSQQAALDKHTGSCPECRP